MAVNGRSATIFVVTGLLATESLVLWAFAIISVVDTVTQQTQSLGAAIFLDATVALAAAASAIATIAFWQGSGAVRGGIIVWQMLQAGVGIASAQGPEPRWDIALALVIPAAIVTTFVLFRREVSRHLGKDA